MNQGDYLKLQHLRSTFSLKTEASRIRISNMKFLTFVLIGLLLAAAFVDLTSAQRRQRPARPAAAASASAPHPNPRHHSHKHHEYHRHIFRKRDLVDFPEYEDAHI